LSGEITRSFHNIWPRLHFPIRREATRILIVENIEARQFVERYSFIENWVWLSSEDIDTVAKIGECFREMTGVHTLATDMRFASVREIRNAQWAVGVVRA
jgi:hypothetical protein